MKVLNFVNLTFICKYLYFVALEKMLQSKFTLHNFFGI